MVTKTRKSKRAKPACVVLDTNQWRDARLLRRPLGASLRFYVNRAGAKLGLPEVVETEVRKHLLKLGMDAVSAIKDNFDIVGAIIGSRSPYEVPTRDEMTAKIDERLSDLDALLIRVPMTLKHARAALERVNAELPPNGKDNQQFKDSLIWEAILRLGKTHVVHFVTADGDFREAGSKGGLAQYLQDECSELGIQVFIYPRLADCLDALRKSTPDLDYQSIGRAIEGAIVAGISVRAAARGFRLHVDGTELYETRAFVTVKPEVISVEFAITFHCSEVQEDAPHPRSNIRIKATGDCSFSLETDKPSDMRLDRITYDWRDDTGEEQHNADAFAYANILIGGPTDVLHTVKVAIEPSQQ